MKSFELFHSLAEERQKNLYRKITSRESYFNPSQAPSEGQLITFYRRQIGDKLKNCFKKAVETRYYHSLNQLKEIFGDMLAEAFDTALFVPRPSYRDTFLAPEEYIKAAFDSDTWTGVVVRQTKANLAQGLPHEFRHVLREELIEAHLFSNNEPFKSFRDLQISKSETLELIKALGDLFVLFCIPFDPYVQVWVDIFNRLALKKQWHVNFQEIESVITAKFREFLDKRWLLILDNDTPPRFSFHPIPARFIEEILRQQRQDKIHKILNGKSLVVARSDLILHSPDNRDFQRRVLLCAAAIATDRLRHTNEGNFRVSDLEKLSRAISGKKKLPVESALIGFIGSNLGYSGLANNSSISSSLCYISPLKLRHEIILQLSHYFHRGISQQDVVSQTLSVLPIGEWFHIQDILRIHECFRVDSIPPKVHEEYFIGTIPIAWGARGEIDLLIDGKDSSIVAIRRREESALLSESHDQAEDHPKIRMLPNLEVPILPSTPASKYLELASFLSPKGLNSFVFDAMAAQECMKRSLKLAEVMRFLREDIGLEVSSIVEISISRLISEGSHVFLGDEVSILCVPDEESRQDIRIQCEGQIVKELMPGVFLLGYSSQIRKLQEKLKNIGNDVELLTTKYNYHDDDQPKKKKSQRQILERFFTYRDGKKDSLYDPLSEFSD